MSANKLRKRFPDLAAKLVIATAAATVLAAGGIGSQARGQGLVVSFVRVGNGGAPFAGDRALFTTISPNGDGFRDTAVVSFRLSRRAVVRLAVYETTNREMGPRLVWQTAVALRRGERRLTWRPGGRIEPRTYELRLLVDGVLSATAVVRVLDIDAGFTRESYGPGQTARLSLSTDARGLTLRFMQAGPERSPNIFAYGNDELHGVPAGPGWKLRWTRRMRPGTLRLRIPSGPSGLYFLQLKADDGREGFAPFVLRPSRIGIHRIAVVFPTHTWQAYNFRDVNGDGLGDTWYAVDTVHAVDVTRPLLHHGVPTHFRGYQVGFLRWLYQSGKQVDFISDCELDRLSGARLARSYDLVVLLGHHEYMTTQAYDALTRYRDLGGNLMFTSTTNFLYRVVRHRRWMIRTQPWRDLGRPEAALIGVEYLHNDFGRHFGSYVVAGREQAPWAFAGTGLHDGDRFGIGGIEIDARSAASPPGTIVLARMANLQGPGLSAEMTYYTTRTGAKVFAPGTLNFAGTALWPSMRIIMENVWEHLARP
jgi:hypothetical protein